MLYDDGARGRKIIALDQSSPGDFLADRWSWLLHVFADGGYAGDKLKRKLRKVGRFKVEIIKRSDKTKGFEVLPRRWLSSEHLHAWKGPEIGKGRRKVHRFSRGMDHDRPYPPHHQTARKVLLPLNSFRVRLLAHSACVHIVGFWNVIIRAAFRNPALWFRWN